MKKTMFVSAMLMLSATYAVAQTKDTGALPLKSGNEWQMPKDVLLRARSFSNRAQQLLGLDSVRTQRLFEVYLGNTKSVDEIRVGSGSDQQKKEALAANQLQFDQTVKSLLTPGQYEKYLRERKAGKL